MKPIYRQPGTLKYYGTVICRHWLLVLPILAVVPLAVGGLLGRGLGIQFLFRDDKSPFEAGSIGALILRFFGSAYFETQIYVMVLFGLLWICVLLLEDKFARLDENYVPDKARVLHYVPGVALLGLLPLFATLTLLSYLLWTGEQLRTHMLVLPVAGYVCGLAGFYALSQLAFSAAKVFKISKIAATLALTCALLIIVVYIPIVLPAKLLFVVLAWVVVIYTALQLMSAPAKVLTMAGVLIVTILSNAVRSEKYTFPGLSEFYAKLLLDRPTLQTYRAANQRVATLPNADLRQPMQCDAASTAIGTGLIDPVLSLQHWHQRMTAQAAPDATNTTAARHPKLVIVATSGGAYRATYWTARVLETLLADDNPGGALQGFRQSIRLLTGASGGMVGSAYLAVEDPKNITRTALSDQIRQDIATSLDTRGFSWSSPLSAMIRNPMASDWDSLSAVARQMVLFDMPAFYFPFERTYDRGRELESHWKSLDRTFASLRDDEAMGLRPSLVITPTLADTGIPLIISNLDFGSIYWDKKETLELFKLLHGAQDKFKVQTAVRMSATFPFISPGVRLPTNPPYRVIDAGYYDNFGIGAAVAYLHEPAIKTWLQNCTSGVMLVQIRAWPQDAGNTPPAPRGLLARWSNSFSWLTTPIEGVANARSTTNFFRNRRELCQLQNLYRSPDAKPRQSSETNCGDSSDFLQTVEFEPDALDENATFTWDLQRRELLQMSDLLTHDNILKAREKLADFWRAPPK